MFRLLILIVVVIVAACSSPSQFTTTSAQFAKAAPLTVEAYRAYLMKVYTLDADTHLRLAELDPSRDVDPVTLQQRSFSQIALDSRLQAMDSLILYSKTLAVAANKDLGANFRSSAIGAGAAFDNLFLKINEASGNDANKVKKIGGPVADIVGVIGEKEFRDMQTGIIRSAIIDAEREISTLISQMKEDVRIGGLLTQPDAATRLAAAAKVYNRQSGTPGFDGDVHRRAVANVKAEYIAFRDQSLLERQLLDLLASLDAANKALARQARSSTEAESLKAFNEALVAIQDLTLSAKTVRASIEQLRD